MSKVQLQGNVNGTGIFTIASPNSNTDRTLTLPDNTGTILTNASTITQNGGPTFSAIAGAGTSLSANTSTKVNFSNEQWDTANCYDTSTSRFTPNVAGYYQISSTVRADITANGVLHIYLQKNGADTYVGDFISVTSSQAASTGSWLVYLNGTTDFVQISAYVSVAGTTTGTLQCSFQGVLVRTA